MRNRYEMCPVAELPPGTRRIVDLDGLSVGVFNVDGEFYALKNECPHHRGPLCEGELSGTTTYSEVGEYDWEREGRIVRCPWHGWEFDVTDGTSVFEPRAIRARTYEATTEPVDRDDSVSEFDDAEGHGGDGSRTERRGDGPPVDTYDVEIEDELVVVYR